MALSRINTKVFLFLFFFHPIPTGCPRLIPGFFCFFFSPFFNGFAMYGRTGLCIFQMVLPRVNTRVFFFFFFSPFYQGFFIIIIFSAINQRSYLGYSISKNKKYDKFSKIMQGRLIVTEGRGYPLVHI